MSGSGTGTPISEAVTFTVEDGSGLSTANSYVSVADADTYHATYTGSTDWSGAENATKERALIAATQYLDIEHEGRWRGVKDSSTQSLAWPRCDAEDSDGYLIDSDALPQKLKDACCELALRVVLGDDLLGVVTEPGDVASESVTVGPISTAVEYVNGRPDVGNSYPRVESLLKSLLQETGRVYRG